MANDRVKRPGAILVVVLIVAMVLLVPHLRRDVTVTRPLPADRPGTRVATEDAAGPIASVTAGPHGLPTPGCEERVRKREAHARALDVGSAGQAAVAMLQHSGDTEHVLAAALMSPDRRQLQQLLDRVLSEDPRNRIAHWKNLENCRALGSECDGSAVEAAVLAVDSANGLVWLDIASARIREERWEEAEDALRRAADAPRFDSYLMEYALLIERGLAATSEMDYAERMIAAMGYGAATWVPGYRGITERCSDKADGYRLPADLCFEVGEQMARNGKELLTTVIGISVQRDAVSRLGDEKLAAELEREKQQTRDAVLRDGAESGAHALMQNDAAVLRRYVETFVAHGEIRAAEALVTEARRLREDPDYDQCNFVGNPDFEPGPKAP